MLRNVYGVMFSDHPVAPKHQHRRPYNVDELKELMAQGKKPKEIAEIMGRSIGSVRQKIREIKS
jgi:DNA-binding NarL/FixJ family response regulator